MAITITFSTDSVTLDETSGLQFLNSAANTAGATDNDDNDVARTTLPTPFSDRLNDLGLSTAFPDLVGVATGTIATVSSDSTPITGVAFNFTNGVSSSFFDLDDNKIFLFHDATDPNIVLLREGTGTVANSSGAIVGAIYLDVDVDGTSTSETVKVWLVQFEAFANLDPTNPDDFLTLANLSLSASSTVDFNFAGAPSGQNYFMAFGDPSAGVLLVSGKDPVDDTDLNQIGDGDTVNTGQGGGDTTLGTNNQKIVSGEGLHFRFVTGMSSGVVAPLLDQNEADVEANTAFTGFLDVTGASVDIVQLQPGSPKAVATVKLSAFSADDTAPLESGTHFAEELDDDDPVTIDGVQVIRNGQDVVGTDVLATFNSDGTLTLTGIKDGDEIKYTTDGTHNHVLVENAGDKKTADFDIGGFHIIQAETESAPIPNILFDDDGVGGSEQHGCQLRQKHADGRQRRCRAPSRN